MNVLNNPVLLLRSHFIVAGQTESTAENIRSNVYSDTCFVGISTAPTVAFNRDKGVASVDRLHMHVLPSTPTILSRGTLQKNHL